MSVLIPGLWLCSWCVYVSQEYFYLECYLEYEEHPQSKFPQLVHSFWKFHDWKIFGLQHSGKKTQFLSHSMICVTDIENHWHWDVAGQKMRVGLICLDWHVHGKGMELFTLQFPYHQRQASSHENNLMLSCTAKLEQTIQIPNVQFSLYYFRGP